MILLLVHRFSHPVGSLPFAALSVNDGAGSIEQVVSSGPRGTQCGDFLVYTQVCAGIILRLQGPSSAHAFIACGYTYRAMWAAILAGTLFTLG